MPMYQYRCQYCGIPFEELVSISGDNPPCPRCGCPHTMKLMSACLSKTGSPDPVKRLLSQRAARRNGDPVGGSGKGGAS